MTNVYLPKQTFFNKAETANQKDEGTLLFCIQKKIRI